MLPPIFRLETSQPSSSYRPEKRRRRARAERLLEILHEFSRETTLHGVRYVTKRRISNVERLLWALAVCSCAAGAVSLGWQAWRKFADSPIVTSVESTVYPLSRLPFPAVTVCPSVCVRKSAAIRTLRRLLNDSSVPEEQLAAAVHALTFYNYQAADARQRHLSHAAALLPRLGDLNVTQFLLQVAIRCEDIFEECLWEGRNYNCCKIFDIQRCESGFCYSFNSLTSERTHHCAGRLRSHGPCSLRHAVGPGAAAGLQVILKPARLHDFLPPHPIFPPGLHIQVHNPFEFPDGRNNLFAQDRVQKVATIKVSPAFTESGGRRLRQVRPSLRNCYFNGEVAVTVYGGYSQSTCMLECRLQHTVNVCNCEPYLFRNVRKNIRQCGVRDLPCLMNNSGEARVMGGVGSRNLVQCLEGCLPACTGIIYDVDAVFAEASKPVEDGDQGYMAVYYSPRAAVKYVRTPAVDELQLLVSLGGIAGLFLGVSLLSVVELQCLALKLLLGLLAGPAAFIRESVSRLSCGRGRVHPRPLPRHTVWR